MCPYHIGYEPRKNMTSTPKLIRLRNYLRMGYPITNRDSIEMFNYFRLSDGIFKLKKPPHNMKIETVMKYENGVQYAVYKLKKR